MSGLTITTLFVASLIAFACGLALGVVALILSSTTDALMMRGPDVVGVNSTPSGAATVAVALTAVLLILGAVTAQMVAWIGGIANTATLVDKVWLVTLLVLGLLGFAFVANIVYLTAAPKPDQKLRPLSRGADEQQTLVHS